MSRVETPTASDPNSSAGNFSGASRMAGASADAPSGADGSQQSAQGDPQQALANAVSVIRQTEQSIVAISQQFPQASAEIRKAREAIRSVLKKIVSNPGGSEPPAPRTGY